jgi:hypothetical protein
MPEAAVTATALPSARPPSSNGRRLTQSLARSLKRICHAGCSMSFILQRTSGRVHMTLPPRHGFPIRQCAADLRTGPVPGRTPSEQARHVHVSCSLPQNHTLRSLISSLHAHPAELPHCIRRPMEARFCLLSCTAQLPVHAHAHTRCSPEHGRTTWPLYTRSPVVAGSLAVRDVLDATPHSRRAGFFHMAVRVAAETLQFGSDRRYRVLRLALSRQTLDILKAAAPVLPSGTDQLRADTRYDRPSPTSTLARIAAARL